MVTKVADEIRAAYARSTFVPIADDDPVWVDLARAAIEAMREPTDDELIAADIDNDTSGAPYCTDFSYFRKQIKQLIDAALSPKET